MSAEAVECQADRHGTRTAYRHDGCRCPAAREAVRTAMASWRKRSYLNRGPLLIDATGTHRRLQALRRLGWGHRELARRLGVARSWVADVSRSPKVTVQTARRVRAVYDELSMRPGPSVAARNHAARMGWPPPLAWDEDAIDDPAARPAVECGSAVDEIAVRRFLAGDGTVSLTWDEKVEAVRLSESHGWSTSQLKVALGLSGTAMAKARDAAQRPLAAS